MLTVPIATPKGIFTAHFSEHGLAALDFPSPARPAKPAALPAKVRQWTALLKTALATVLDGGKPTRLPPLDLTRATQFRRSVWMALRRIPTGHTRTYTQIAVATGHPRSARAVGQACAANPIPVLIPCHRVLASGGRLGGFSGGLSWKRRLLELEGAWPPPRASIAQPR